MRLSKKALSSAAAMLGRKGGRTAVRKHGVDKFKEWGKLGGRPHKKLSTGVEKTLQPSEIMGS